jgi:hypothetical protein
MTKGLSFITFVSAIVTVVAGACGGNAEGPPAGGARQPCYGNGTCNAGLTCASGICVDLGDGGSDGSSGSSASSSASSGSSAGSSGSGSGGSTSSGSGSSSFAESGAQDAPVDTASTPDAAESYEETVLADAPAGYWRLDDTGSVAADVSTHHLDGTYQGGVTKSAPGALRNAGDPAVSLDGSSGYITTGFTQMSVTTYSVEAWFKTSAAGSGYYIGPIFQDRGADSGLSLTLAMSAGNQSTCAAGHVLFVLDTYANEGGICSGSAYNDGSWHHVVATFSAAPGASVQCGTSAWGTWSTWTTTNCPEFQLYIDGGPAPAAVVSGGTLPFSAPLTGSGSAIAGYQQPWASYWPGSLDELAVYLTALPAARVAAHYHAAGY